MRKTYYADVFFQGDESKAYGNFLKKMNELNIIEMSPKDIKKDIADFKSEPWGAGVELVLHSKKERDLFEKTIETSFSNKTYLVSNDPTSGKFKEWLDKQKNAQKTSH